MKVLDPKYIEILKNCDTPTVCNAIELLDIRPRNQGFLQYPVRAFFPELPPMVGYAVTLTCRSASPSADKSAYGDLGKYVEPLLSVPAPRVLVVHDLDDEPMGATAGEMVGATYMAFGCVGLVTNGSVRDTEALHRRKWPVFAAKRCCSHAYARPIDMNVPVEITGVTMKPGDLLHGDADGVTTIPMEFAPEIAALSEKLIEAEREFFAYADSGAATPEGISASHAKVSSFGREELERIRRRLAR